MVGENSHSGKDNLRDSKPKHNGRVAFPLKYGPLPRRKKYKQRGRRKEKQRKIGKRPVPENAHIPVIELIVDKVFSYRCGVPVNVLDMGVDAGHELRAPRPQRRRGHAVLSPC